MTLKSKLGRIANSFDDIMDTAGDKGAEQIATRAKQIMREKDIIDTEDTLKSIEAKRIGQHTWRIAPGTDYALFLEAGHHTRSGSFVPARPYMGPAGEAEFPGILTDIKDAIEGAVR